MSRLNVKSMFLEVTRNCNLECGHCFRGSSEKKFMPIEVIDLIFNEVCRINEFYLTGGEPLLATNQIERIVKNIKKERINIGNFIIVTNGTVLSDDLLNMFDEINKRSNLEFRISTDMFHTSEIKKKNLVKITNDNISILNSRYNVVLPEEKVFIIDRIGKAKNLTEKDLDLLKKVENTNTKYVFSTEQALENFRKNLQIPRILEEDNVVEGTVNIDVNGKITPTYYSYKEEDKYKCGNIKKTKSLKKILESIN